MEFPSESAQPLSDLEMVRKGFPQWADQIHSVEFEERTRRYIIRDKQGIVIHLMHEGMMMVFRSKGDRYFEKKRQGLKRVTVTEALKMQREAQANQDALDGNLYIEEQKE